MNILETSIRHLKRKVKGTEYTHIDLAKLMRKKMREEKDSYESLSKRYKIKEVELEAMCSGRYYYKFEWYEIISDYTGITIKELTKIKDNKFNRDWKAKCNIR